MSDDFHTRISILETRQEYGLSQVAQNHEAIVDVMNRLDEHMIRTDERFATFMQSSNDRHSVMSVAIAENTTALKNISSTMENVAVMSTKSNEEIEKFKSITKTISVITGIICTLATGLWIVVTYFHII